MQQDVEQPAYHHPAHHLGREASPELAGNATSVVARERLFTQLNIECTLNSMQRDVEQPPHELGSVAEVFLKLVGNATSVVARGEVFTQFNLESASNPSVWQASAVFQPATQPIFCMVASPILFLQLGSNPMF